MRNLYQLLLLLQKYSGHTPLLTDSELGAMLPLVVQGITDCRLKTPLFAEVWARHWLYVSKWGRPRTFTEVLDKFSPTFQNAFKELAQPWRNPRIEGDPLPSAEPPEVNVTGDELAVWQEFWKRLGDFVCCDGLLAIALLEEDCSEPKEAVAVPFRLNGANEIRDASQERQKLGGWSQAVGWLQEDYYHHSLGADLLGVFPPQPNLDGESVTLALLLARERERAVDLPEFFPLDMLATGAFRSGRLHSVGGLKAKGDLVDRVGCRWFLRPENSSMAGALLPGTPLAELLSQVGHQLASNADKRALARRALAVCKKRLLTAELVPAEAATILRRLIRIRPALGGTPEAESCRKAIREAAVSMKASSFATVDFQIESLLEAYGQMPFHGREPSLNTLDRFLKEPGGIMLVTGKVGYGKTALMTQLLNRIPSDRAVFRHFFSFNHHATRTLENFHAHLGLFLAALLGKSRLESSYDEGAITVLLDELRDELETHRLVFVLDGLDEATEILQPHYLRDLPKGIHVIAAARSSGEDQPERYLEPWHELEIRILNLGELSDEDLKAWLQHHTTSSALRFLSANTTFRQLLHERASGCPRFIADVVAYLAQVEDLRDTWQTRLTEVPKDYSDFVRKQYHQLESTSDFNSSHMMFLGLLCAAEGELSVREIQLLLGEMTKLPPGCERWISTYSSTDGDGDKYALQTLQIRDALREVIPWSDQERKLVEHCQTWTNHGTPYSLRHYATHLKTNWPMIADLVLDARYRVKVAKHLPDETDLPLLVLRSALERAIDVSDWEGTACLMLARAALGNRMLDYQWRKEDPLEKSAGEAAEVLSHSDLGRAALLRLIKGWTLKWKGQPKSEIEKVRQELTGQKLSMLNGLEADVAAELLFRVFEPDDERLVHIAAQLLDEEARRDLVGLLADLQICQGFVGARRVLQTFPKTRRRETNPHFDKAVNALTVALAKAGRWREVLELSEGLLQRQATLNLVEAGRVAAEKKDLNVLNKFRDRIIHVTESCASWEELRERGIMPQDLPWWRGTPKDRYTCRSNQARLTALIGLASENGEAARLEWQSAFALANGMKDKPEQRFHALRELVFVILETVDRKGFEFVLAPVRAGDTSMLVRFLNETDDALQDMCRNDQVFFSTVAHALVKLCRLGEEISHVAPRAVSDLRDRISCWREALVKRADMLNAEDRDRLWLGAAVEATESPRLDIGWVLTAARNIKDRQMSDRAVAKLVRRLYQDRKGRLADRIGEGDKRLQHPVRLAAGLATLDFSREKSTKQLFYRCQPRRAKYSVQRLVLKSELAASLKQIDPNKSKKLIIEAVKQVNDHRAGPHDIIRFRLNIAEAAWRAGDKQTANDLLRVALKEVLEEKRRVEKHWKTIARAYASQWRDEALDEHLSPSDYVDAVDSLCAVSRIEQLVNPDRNTPDALWKTLLDFAHKIAKQMVPGISSRTGALAEVAETANLLRQSGFATYIFEEMHRFIHDRLNSFGEMRIRREKETCLGELMLGVLKAHFWQQAKRLKSDLLAVGTGSQRRKIQDTTALHAIAWLCVCEYDLRAAWPYLHQIKNAEERSKTARDMAVSLAHQGNWRKITEVVAVIVRGELKQKHLHKIVQAVAKSDKIQQHERKLVYQELLWACSETFDSALATLAHLVRYERGTGLAVANALTWAESQGIQN